MICWPSVHYLGPGVSKEQESYVCLRMAAAGGREAASERQGRPTAHSALRAQHSDSDISDSTAAGAGVCVKKVLVSEAQGNRMTNIHALTCPR